PGAEPRAGGPVAGAGLAQLLEVPGVALVGVPEVVPVGRADAARGRALGGLFLLVERGAQRDRGAVGGAAGETVQVQSGEWVAVVGPERDRERGVPGGVIAADAAGGVVVEVDVGERQQRGAQLDGVRLAAQR